MRMTIQEYAKHQKVHKKTVEEWIRQGKLLYDYSPSGRKIITGEIKLGSIKPKVRIRYNTENVILKFYDKEVEDVPLNYEGDYESATGIVEEAFRSGFYKVDVTPTEVNTRATYIPMSRIRAIDVVRGTVIK